MGEIWRINVIQRQIVLKNIKKTYPKKIIHRKWCQIQLRENGFNTRLRASDLIVSSIFYCAVLVSRSSSQGFFIYISVHLMKDRKYSALKNKQVRQT